MEVCGDEGREVVDLPLADDLADMWRDLRARLSLVGVPETAVDAVWEWQLD